MIMHPDDERELMDEISGATHYDWLYETYGPTAVDAYEYPEPPPTLRERIKSRLWLWGYKFRKWRERINEEDLPF